MDRRHQSIRVATLTLTVLATASVARSGTTCGSCDTRIILTGNQVKCVERRLTEYLAEPRDPVLISLVGCDHLDKDSRRLEPATRIFGATEPGQANGAKEAYIIQRSDAVCLLERLKARHQARSLTIDLTSC